MCTLPSERLNIAQREAGKKNIVPGDGVGGGGVWPVDAALINHFCLKVYMEKSLNTNRRNSSYQHIIQAFNFAPSPVVILTSSALNGLYFAARRSFSTSLPIVTP